MSRPTCFTRLNLDSGTRVPVLARSRLDHPDPVQSDDATSSAGWGFAIEQAMLRPRLLSRLPWPLPPYGAAPALVYAQTTPSSSSHCNGQRISDIHVSTLRPPFTGEAAYWRRVAHSLGLHHTTTDTVVVRRFLALQKGGVCTDFRMRESARLLREEPFIANARVWAVPADSGRVRIEVETVDEIPVVASGAVAAGRPSYLEIGNQNMFGDAWLLAVHGSNRILEGQSAGFRRSEEHT